MRYTPTLLALGLSSQMALAAPAPIKQVYKDGKHTIWEGAHDTPPGGSAASGDSGVHHVPILPTPQYNSTIRDSIHPIPDNYMPPAATANQARRSNNVNNDHAEFIKVRELAGMLKALSQTPNARLREALDFSKMQKRDAAFDGDISNLKPGQKISTEQLATMLKVVSRAGGSERLDKAFALRRQQKEEELQMRDEERQDGQDELKEGEEKKDDTSDSDSDSSSMSDSDSDSDSSGSDSELPDSSASDLDDDTKEDTKEEKVEEPKKLTTEEKMEKLRIKAKWVAEKPDDAERAMEWHREMRETLDYTDFNGWPLEGSS